MPEEIQERTRVCLMGPPRIRAGADGPEVSLEGAERELLALLIIGTLLLPPDGVWREIRDSQGHAGYEVRREWLVETLIPNGYIPKDRPNTEPTIDPQQAARDRVGYLLNRMHPRGASDPPLSFRLLPDGESRERGVARVTWRHLDIDVAELLEAAKNLHGPASQEKIMALAARPLLEGMAYPWLQRPEFRRAGAHLDAGYLAALCGRADSLLVLMENARANGRANEVYSYRTKVLPLLDRAVGRLQGAEGRLDAPELEALRQFPLTLGSLRARASYLPPTSPQFEGAADIVPSPPSHNLPSPVTSFVGREQERRDIRNLLLSGRLVTLTGMGGCGKTRLAVQTAWELLGDWKGIRLVELAALTASDQVPQAVATALSVTEQKGVSVTEALITFLQGKQTLLLLDNCEHLLLDGRSETVDCGTFVARLLYACPDLSVLATSRKPLNIDGEHLYPVSPLPFPAPDFLPAGTTDPVAALLGYDAARLLVDRVFQFRRFALEPENVRPVAAICAALDGIPLALELAAARVKALPLERIAEMLSDRFGLLTNGRRESPARHKTLRAVIDWSYDLLTEPERLLLCRLSVFAGGWTLDAAETVGTSEGADGGPVLDLLTSLVDKSLVVFEAASGRYRMLETVRHYAGDRLRERGAWGETRRRHRNFFLTLAENAAPQLRGPEQKNWLDRLGTEHDNLRAALEWRADEAGLRLACALQRFWWVRGYLEEGRRWLERDVANDAIISEEVQARVLMKTGALAQAQGALAEARKLFEEGLALQVRQGDQQSVADALFSLGSVVEHLGDWEEALEWHQKSLELSHDLGYDYGIATALYGLAVVHQNQDNYPVAIEMQQESLTLRRKLGDVVGIGNSLSQLGELAYKQGRFEDAKLLHEKSLALWLALGQKRGTAHSLSSLGSLARVQGDYGAARYLYNQSLALSQDVGDKYGVADILNGLATLAYNEGDFEEARKLMERCLALLRVFGGKSGVATLLSNLGSVARQQERFAESEKLLIEGLVLHQQLEERSDVANSLGEIAFLAAAEGGYHRAARLWGAEEMMSELVGYRRPPNEDAPREQAILGARKAMASEAFDTAWAAGRAMTWEQAVAFALGEDPS